MRVRYISAVKIRVYRQFRVRDFYPDAVGGASAHESCVISVSDNRDPYLASSCGTIRSSKKERALTLTYEQPGQCQLLYI